MYIVIEGNIGCGKSTLLKSLQQRLDASKYAFIQEPVQAFAKYKEYNPLLLSYQEPTQNAAITQHHIITQSAQTYPKVQDVMSMAIIISERSVNSPFIFITAAYKLRIFSAFVKQYLEDSLELNKKIKKLCEPDLIIYLQASPHVCFDRLQKRGRSEEVLCTLDYIKCLNEIYREYLLATETLVLTFNAEVEQHELTTKVLEVINRIGVV